MMDAFSVVIVVLLGSCLVEFGFCDRSLSVENQKAALRAGLFECSAARRDAAVRSLFQVAVASLICFTSCVCACGVCVCVFMCLCAAASVGLN